MKFFDDKEVDGVKGWWWVATDTGAWDGPMDDWQTSHKEMIIKHVPMRGAVVQAGGNCGMYPVLLSKIFGQVYTFEPDALNYSCLQRNIENIPNIKARLGAIGQTEGTCKVIRKTMHNVGMHQVAEGSDVGMYQLDLVADLLDDPVDLIMLDIEGYEEYALKGAKRIIDRWKPVIFAENPNSESIEFLKELGYSQVDKSKMDVVFTHNSR